MGTIVLGDLNVHNERCLRHSGASSVERTAMKAACDEAGLKQIATMPTKSKHLLDLVFTNITSARATVPAAIANHKMATAHLTFNAPE